MRLRSAIVADPLSAAFAFVVFMWFGISLCLYFVESSVESGNIKTPEDAIWWGIVTLLTVGYGDRYPITTEGRLLAALLMVAGVLGIAIITAKISSVFLARALLERRGFVDSQSLKNHFVICGWKEEMANFLMQMLDSNAQIKSSDIVLLNNAPDQEIESLLAFPRLKQVKVIRGDFYLEANLLRTAPERAAKILILSDATPSSAGVVPTPVEADARTVMTAMTLNSIARGVPVVAEIQDASMDQYLKLAQVNEIIYSRDYARLLLATASTGVGVTNIFHDLLNPRSPFFLTTRAIPSEASILTYGEVRSLCQKAYPDDTVIGILENSGNSHVAKELAIRKAQQTPDIGQLVANLQSVKSLRFNQPQFGLRDDYVIREGAMVIVIENRGGLGG